MNQEALRNILDCFRCLIKFRLFVDRRTISDPSSRLARSTPCDTFAPPTNRLPDVLCRQYVALSFLVMYIAFDHVQ